MHRITKTTESINEGLLTNYFSLKYFRWFKKSLSIIQSDITAESAIDCLIFGYNMLLKFPLPERARQSLEFIKPDIEELKVLDELSQNPLECLCSSQIHGFKPQLIEI